MLARQEYNLGNPGKWFSNFRKGLNGFGSRLLGVETHYRQVHEWQPRLRHPEEPEYHLATIFFHMDSALECFTYALNALGYGFAPDQFVDITSEKALRAIAPTNIIGSDSRAPVKGYELFFPELQRHWKDSRELIAQIMDLHDVSKHRSTIFVGGRMRNDAPSGFFEYMQVPDDRARRSDFAPMAEIILMPEPKLPSTMHVLVTSALQRHDQPEDLVVRKLGELELGIYAATGRLQRLLPEWQLPSAQIWLAWRNRGTNVPTDRP
ncbi:hypothetical protein [Variovorax sp. J22R115]|uniref:hypothetical protein n=1 Tax=Variovorax sp. J22R115 TaxID=3053509 RepID=UPI002575EBF2|nr:hypothetical protein [Variovorax sp. J22R115]